MKRLISLMLALILAVSMLASCINEKDIDNILDATDTEAAKDTSPENDDTDKETNVTLSKDPVRVFTIKGPTGMGMAPLMKANDDKTAKLNYNFTVANAADEFTGNIVQGEFEIACVPTNLAAVLHSKTNGAIEVAAVNTLGVLYVVEDGNTINSVYDLEGKTIYSAGQGAVPEYALKYILDTFGINCEVIYEAEHDVVVADIMTNTADVALLPEPKVTAALKNEKAPADLRVALDLNDLWAQACEKNGDDSVLYMGCIIVNKEWANSHQNELSAFLEEYKNSVDAVNGNPETASQIIAEYGIIPKAPLAKAAIPNAKIVFITGDEMKIGLNGFYEILAKYNPKAIGGSVPAENIYRK